ncbi:MAG: hypothetical protein QY322_00085 [bacterium]|nr:MAG: hypothetical protein QY322_00085 [bacterium]
MRRQKYRQKKHNNGKKMLLLSLILLFISVIFIWIYFAISIPRLQKFIFLNKTVDGGGEVVIVGSETVSKYLIDSQKLLVSSRGLGEYKLDSLWVLGEKEGYSGMLAVESVAKNYSIPIYLWKDGNKSNLSLSQAVKLKLVKFNNIKLLGSFESFDLPKAILVEFVDDSIQERGVLVEVDDYTGSQRTIESVSAILGVMGTKISGYSKGNDDSFDCVVLGRDKLVVNKIASVFGCEQDIENRDNVKIRLGGKFSERF